MGLFFGTEEVSYSLILSALSHLRPLHTLRLNPGTRLLRSPRGFQGSIPLGREGARLRWGLTPLWWLRGSGPRRHGPCRHCSRQHTRSHVLCLMVTKSISTNLGKEFVTTSVSSNRLYQHRHKNLQVTHSQKIAKQLMKMSSIEN